jgi:hypothetical protein
MPKYTIINKDTEEEWEVQCSWDELQAMLSENPGYKQGLSTPNFITQPGSTISKTSGDWRDHLKRMKKHSGKNNSINV